MLTGLWRFRCADSVVFLLETWTQPGGPAAHLTTWPAGLAMPDVSALNFSGSIVANAAIVPAGANGYISIYANFPTDVLLDMNGYFAP
jgi:hypothetical protein